MEPTPRRRARRRAPESAPQAAVAPAEVAPAPEPAAAAIADEVELLEDRTRPITGHGPGRRLGVSLPGAIAGTLLISALALGASFSPTADLAGRAGADGPAAGADEGDAPDGEQADADGPAADEPKDEPGAEDGGGPKDDPGAEDGDGPKDEPGAEDEPKPEPPAIEVIEIGVGLNDGNVVVEWRGCDIDGFIAYKIVRSTDNAVTYPRGDNDTIVAGIENARTTRFVDTKAPVGKRIWYRIFALASFDGGARVTCHSGGLSIVRPAPEPKPEPQPEPEPDRTLGLVLSIKEGMPFVDWTGCEVAGFDAYKVVRSKDATVSWPLGAYDTVIAAVGPDGKTAVFDESAPKGKKSWYRVFCLAETEAGLKVVASSAVQGIVRPAPEPEPIPDPSVMGFEVEVTGEGVVLHWEQCSDERFAFYKVIRSHQSNPSYLPGTEGSQVIAAFENHEVTEFVDEAADAGTWYYRVQSIGYVGDHKVVLGQTPVRSVTIE